MTTSTMISQPAEGRPEGEPTGRTLPTPTPFWVVTAMVVAGALAMRLAFPQPGWWWLMLPGLVLVLGSTAVEARPRTVILAGLAGGWAFYLPLVHWATLFLGWLPWFALGTVMALSWALGYTAMSWAARWGRRAWPGRAGSWLLTPVVLAGLWTARDQLASSWPYGGFAWGRVAQSLAWSPLLPLVSWLGLAGTGFLLVLVAAWFVAAIRVLLMAPERGWRRGVPLAGALAVFLTLMVVPDYHVTTTGTVRVAGIQGGSDRAGYFMGGKPGDVLAAHLRATALLDPAARPDVVVWPEGSAEWDPEKWPQLEQQFDQLVVRYGAPFLLGSGTESGGLHYQSEYVWPSTGGQRRIYDKHNPVPFGEYVPDRAFYQALVPGLVGLIGRDYSPGTGSPVLSLTDRAGRPVPVGVAICFDIIDDSLGRSAVRDGATWLVSPTNNADFGRTDELDQQLAFARLRAVETGRSLVQVSTVGHTAAFGPDGRVLATVPWYTPEAMVVDVPLAEGITPAVRYGALLQSTGSALGLLGLVCAGLLVRLRPRRPLEASPRVGE